MEKIVFQSYLKIGFWLRATFSGSEFTAVKENGIWHFNLEIFSGENLLVKCKIKFDFLSGKIRKHEIHKSSPEFSGEKFMAILKDIPEMITHHDLVQTVMTFRGNTEFMNEKGIIKIEKKDSGFKISRAKEHTLA